MTKGSDNAFPSLLITEGTEPSAPAAGKQRLYIDSTTHLLKATDSSGTDRTIEGATGGGEFTEQATAIRTAGDVTTTSTTFVDLTGMSVTLTTAAVRCLVIVSLSGKNNSASSVGIDIAIDGARQGQAFGLIVSGAGTDAPENLSLQYLTAVLSAAPHTIKIQWRVDGGTGTIFANTTTVPARLTVIETSMAS